MNDLWSNFERKSKKYCKFMAIDEFDYSINISLRYNYLYSETPKAACSTIKSVLQRIELSDPDLNWELGKDIHDRYFSPLLRPSQLGSLDQFIEKNTPFKFCFSRNPYSRLLAAYLDKIHSLNFYDPSKKPNTDNSGPKRNILMFLGKDPSKLNYDISFEDFIALIAAQPVADMDAHWRIQYYQTFQSFIDYDFIGKIETFSKDFQFVLKKIIPDYNKFFKSETRHSKHANSKLRKYYTPSIIENVQQKFAIDFEYFDYDPELHTSDAPLT